MILENNRMVNFFFYQDCDLICDFFFKALYIHIQRHTINHCIVCSVGHATFKKNN